MFSHSGTQTPVSASYQQQSQPHQLQNKVQFHEQLDETITWINDWYSPNLINNNTIRDANYNKSGQFVHYSVDTNKGHQGHSNRVSTINNFEEENSTPAVNDSIRLKGWHRTNLNHKHGESNEHYNNLNPSDVLDLNKWRYFNEVNQNENNTTMTTNKDAGVSSAAVKQEDPVSKDYAVERFSDTIKLQ